MISFIRWALVLPLAATGWICVFIGALAMYALTDAYCPAGYFISGGCTWTWAVFAKDAILLVAASVSASVFVLVATLTAPSNKAHVAVLSYILGLGVAFWMLYETEAVAPFAGAACFGLMTAWIAFRRLSRRPRWSDGYQRRLFV